MSILHVFQLPDLIKKTYWVSRLPNLLYNHIFVICCLNPNIEFYTFWQVKLTIICYECKMLLIIIWLHVISKGGVLWLNLHSNDHLDYMYLLTDRILFLCWSTIITYRTGKILIVITFKLSWLQSLGRNKTSCVRLHVAKNNYILSQVTGNFIVNNHKKQNNSKLLSTKWWKLNDAKRRAQQQFCEMWFDQRQ